MMKTDQPKKAYYDLDDFYRVEKIDAHLHINHDLPEFMEEARKTNFKLLTVNADYPGFPPLETQEQIALAAMRSAPDMIAFAATFYMKGWDEPGWQHGVLVQLDRMIDAGACAVKVWKNIGMDFRNANGELIMIDHVKFDKIFAHLSQKKIPLIGHLGEPKSCWQPIGEIQINYIRDYFSSHPQYHMFLHPEMPSYENQLQARDQMLAKNPHIGFVGAHLASLEWSVDELGRFLDRFPEAAVDMAARMWDLQVQSCRDREKVRQFFINYQDRILYSTDMFLSADTQQVDLISEAKKMWLADWQYLATDSLMTSNEFAGSFRGLYLPAVVLDKIYSLNTRRKFPRGWQHNW
jgi:hypothetical protein